MGFKLRQLGQQAGIVGSSAAAACRPPALKQSVNSLCLPAPALASAPACLTTDRYLDNMTSERVDAEGMAHVAAAAAKYMQRTERSVEDVLSMRSAEDLAKWQR